MSVVKRAIRRLMTSVTAFDVPGRYVVLRALRPLIVEDERVSTTAYGDLVMDLDLRDWIQLEMYFSLYEPKDVRLLRRLARPGDVVFDIGANVGLYTIGLGKAVGATGHVHAFEPVPSNARAIERHTALNGLSDLVSVNQVAVADPGTTSIDLYLSGDETDTGGPSIVPSESRKRRISVPCLTLDEYIDAQRIDAVRLIKLDIEGAELLALRGLEAAIARGIVSMIYFEINPFHLRYEGLGAPDLKRFLRSRGYQLFSLHGSRLRSVDENRMERLLLNVLAVQDPLVRDSRVADVVIAPEALLLLD